MRTVILGLIAFGLAVAVFLVWPRGSDEEPAGTTVPATSTSTPETATTLTVEVTTTTDDSHVVETVEEAEEILRELWFGWFEGIYNQDEERIREVVVLEETVETARDNFGTVLSSAPKRSDINFQDTEILQSDSDCLAIWTVMVLSGFRAGDADGVNVLRWVNGRWKTLSVWSFREDLWEEDCASTLPAS